MTALEPFASLPDLQDRLDWTLSADESRIASSALDDLSDEARFYGRDWPDPTVAPRMVRTIVLRAAQRFMRNPDGYIQSRAGDETVIWSDSHKPGGSASFTDDEKKLLGELGGKSRSTIQSVPISAHGPQRRLAFCGIDGCIDGCPRCWTEGFVPVEPVEYVPGAPGSISFEKPFPLFRDDESPW